MSFQCGCERGGDCTRVSVCTMENELDDQAEEFQHRIYELEAKLEAIEQLPALWKRRMARPWQPCAQPDRFISDLTEALQEQEG